MIEHDIKGTRLTAGDMPTRILWGTPEGMFSNVIRKEVVRAPRLHEVDGSHAYRDRGHCD